MTADELFRASFERHAQGLLCLLVVTFGQWVNAVVQQHANLACPLFGLVERDAICEADFDDTRLFVQGVAVTPGLSASRCHRQQEISLVDSVELSPSPRRRIVDLVLDEFGVKVFHGRRLNSQFDSQETLLHYRRLAAERGWSGELTYCQHWTFGRFRRQPEHGASRVHSAR